MGPSIESQSKEPSELDLRVRIGALELANPIIAASGTFGYGVEFSHLVDLSQLGAIVTKGLSLGPIAGAPPPRLHPTAGGILNAVGLQNIGVHAFVREKLPELQRLRATVVANVFGRSFEEYSEVIQVLEDARGISAYELNISCPNTERGGAEFGSTPQMTAEIVASVRAYAKKPLWVKLAPAVGRVREFALAAESAGADALTIANTYPALAFDISSGKPILGNGCGGLSGPAIRPITLKLVWEAKRSVQIPIIGLGGVEKAEDAIEYFLAGASAVQVGTAHFTDPKASAVVLASLRNLMVRINCKYINELHKK